MARTKKLIWFKSIDVPNVFVGNRKDTLTITGKIYRVTRSYLGFKMKPKYSYVINTPFIGNPWYDGEFATNRILEVKSWEMRAFILDTIEELKQKDLKL